MRRATIGLAIAAALVAGGAILAGPPAAPPDPRIEARQLKQENDRLRVLAGLAEGDTFYLVLEVSSSELRLMLKGALLKTWKISGIEVGSPRRLFIPRELPEDWRGRVWDAGRLDPLRELERVEVEVPDSPDEVQPIEPLDAEAAIPAPARFFVRYEGGLALEIVAGEGGPAGGAFTRLGRAWSDALSAVAGPAALRVRLVLPPAEAAAIYRSLPQPIRLVVF